ncbi:hypothetical protein AWB79_03614 [Caballeronia hypogeia]|uniref:IrrE N-terminal-like domain-containing protein n=1 Tax=Caballeronia hypogeia TaxID=1777140 RepID=A0A158BFI0_9BURK|nr:ImmA/IrrE family metallo-endopeptidase [Caballeronia hypogeia]SAK68822.1 hypothetical protein AWB79_03614 [Caballeronia hypogeia]
MPDDTMPATLPPRDADVLVQIERSLLDRMLADSTLYRNGPEFRALLDFVVKLRNFAPFNAMLLQIQRPGLRHAASARDWRERFGRYPKEDARPLLILWPFGPVALVYDAEDTEGHPLPGYGAPIFEAVGPITPEIMLPFETILARKNITVHWYDGSPDDAGYIESEPRVSVDDATRRYRLGINVRHHPAVQFATLAHELGHLFLGHLKADPLLRIQERPRLHEHQCEIEAESVAYLVCHRNGVMPRSERYLAHFVEGKQDVRSLDLYAIMRAAGQIETLLGLTIPTRFDRN